MLVDLLSVTLRALSFVALFQAAGTALFLALVGRHLAITGDAIRRFGLLSATVAAVLVLAHYALEAGRMSGDLAGVADRSLQTLVLHSSSSTALALRLIGLMLVAIGLRARQRFGTMLSVVGALLTAAAFTSVGHTSTHSMHGLLSGVLLAHLLAVAFWFGALIPLAVVSARESAGVAGQAIDAFSKLATVVVPGLLLAGVVLALSLVRSLAVLSTPYGRLLLAKAGGFALLMVPAAVNKWRLAPAIAAGDAQAAISLRRSVAIEYVLIVGILTVTAVMTTFFSPEET